MTPGTSWYLPRPKIVSRNQIRKWKAHWNCRCAISSPSELRNCCDCFVTGSFSVAIIKFWVSSSSQNSLFSTCVQQKFWLVVWFRRNIFRLRRLQNSKMYNQVVVSTIELRVIWYPEGYWSFKKFTVETLISTVGLHAELCAFEVFRHCFGPTCVICRPSSD